MTDPLPRPTIDINGLLEESFRIANNNFFLILVFILLVNSPVYCTRILIQFLYLTSIYDESTTKMILWGFDIVRHLFGIFTFIGVAFITQESINNKPRSLKSTFSFSFSRFVDVVWTYVVTTLLIIGRLLLLIFPAIIFSITSSFSTIASALRFKRGNAAISFSEQLVEGRWWKIFGYQILFTLFTLSCTTIM